LSCELSRRNVLANGVGPQLIRFVTHLDVSRDQCAQAIEALTSICASNVRYFYRADDK